MCISTDSKTTWVSTAGLHNTLVIAMRCQTRGYFLGRYTDCYEGTITAYRYVITQLARVAPSPV